MVILGLLKESQLTNGVISEVLERLNIKSSLLDKKAPAFGDVCDACGKVLATELNKAIEDGIRAISDALVSIGAKTKSKLPEVGNARWFHEMAGDVGWTRPK